MPADPYSRRRARVLAALGDDALLLFGAPHATRNADTEYRYRPASDLVWLSGWEDPEAALLLRPHSDAPFVLFVQPKDPAREVWTGRRAGVEGARERHGADAAWPIEELARRLPLLLQGHETLHVRLGEDPGRDARVLGGLRGAARAGARNGVELPWRFSDPARLLGPLRCVKDPEELLRLRRAAALSAEAHVEAMRVGVPGAFEYEVEAAIDHLCRRRGGTGVGYPTIVGGGANGCVLHYVRNGDPLRDGDLCLVDAGGEVDWYTADITRTWPVGGRFSAPQRELYDIVLAAQLAAIDVARAGRPYKDMHDAAVRVLAEGMVRVGLCEGEVDEVIVEERYKRYYMHNTGHWLGLDVHDAGPYWRGGGSIALEPDMVVTVEPGIYVAPDDEAAPERFRGIGIRIEDDVRITDGEPEVLTAACPKFPDEVEAACRRA